MATYVFWTGFEWGTSLTVDGGGLFDSITGSPSIITTPHSGAYSLQVNPSGSAMRAGWDHTSGTIGVSRFYIQFPVSLPSANCNLAFHVASDAGRPGLWWNSSTNKFAIGFDGGDQNDINVTVSTSTWYAIDLLVNTSTGGNQTVDGKVNGTAGTQATATGTTTLTGFRCGTTGADTFTALYDDVGVSVTSGDYPLTHVAAKVIYPSSDGTHNAGTNVMEYEDGTDLSTPNAYLRVDDIMNGSENSIYWRQANNGTGNYGEVNFYDQTNGTDVPIAVKGILAWGGGGNPTCTGAAIIIRNDASEHEIYGTPASPTDYSVTSPIQYTRGIVGVPSGGWTNSEVAALKARMGYSSDANPDPYWYALRGEVLYEAASGTTYDDALTLARYHAVTEANNLVIDGTVTLAKFNAQGDDLIATYETANTLAKYLTQAIINEGNINTALTLGRLLSQTQTAGLVFEGTLDLGYILALSQIADLTTDQALTVAKSLGMTAITESQLYPSLTLARALAITSIVEGNINTDTTLAKYLGAQMAGGVVFDGTVELGYILAVSLLSGLAADGLLTLAKNLGIANDNTLDALGALTLDRVQAVTNDTQLQFETQTVLGLILQATIDNTLDATGAVDLARALGITTSGGADIADTIELARLLALTPTTTSTMETALTLAKAIAQTQADGGTFNIDTEAIGKILTAFYTSTISGGGPPAIAKAIVGAWRRKIRPRGGTTMTNPAYGVITGIVTVTTAGTEVTGPDVENTAGFILKGLPANTGTVWVMTTGAAKAAGFPLAPGDTLTTGVINLNQLDFDADISGEKIAWAKM